MNAHALLQHTMAASAAYPPGYSNSPAIYGCALFSMMLSSSLGMAAIMRMWRVTKEERRSLRDPIVYHRMVIGLLLTSMVMNRAPDCAVMLLWNEATVGQLYTLRVVWRVLEALSVIPFLAALFLPFVVLYLSRFGVMRAEGIGFASGQDIRRTWGPVGIPVQITLCCLLAAAGVAAVKWTTGHP